MIPSRDEIQKSIFGAWRLLHYDRAAPYFFNLSIDGLRRSFMAPLAMLPLALLSVVLARVNAEVPTFSLIGETLGYVAFFVLWPLILIPVARAAGLTRSYVPYVIAYNWSIVIIMVFMLPASVAQAAQAERGGAGDIIYLVLALGSMAYQFMVARLAFQASAALATGLVVLDFALTLLIGRVVNTLFY